jgi:hypothetical protein
MRRYHGKVQMAIHRAVLVAGPIVTTSTVMQWAGNTGRIWRLTVI